MAREISRDVRVLNIAMIPIVMLFEKGKLLQTTES